MHLQVIWLKKKLRTKEQYETGTVKKEIKGCIALIQVHSSRFAFASILVYSPVSIHDSPITSQVILRKVLETSSTLFFLLLVLYRHETKIVNVWSNANDDFVLEFLDV